ncbi:hypothetical protein OROGR_026077 [Orobanche gracilis]
MEIGHTSGQSKDDGDIKPTVVFWDIENCGLPRGVMPDVLPMSIVSVFKQLGITCKVEEGLFRIYLTGDLSKYNRRKRNAIMRIEHTEIIDTPAVIIEWACANLTPVNVMMVSGDQDFTVMVSFLQQMRHTVVVAGIDSNALAPQIRWAAGENLLIDWRELCSNDNLKFIDNNRVQVPSAILLPISGFAPTQSQCSYVFVCMQIRTRFQEALGHVVSSPIQIFAYGNFEDIPREQAYGLHDSSIFLRHVPPGTKRFGWSGMLPEILRWSKACSSSKAFLIISNSDYKDAVKSLREGEHMVMIANSNNICYRDYPDTYIWSWPVFLYGHPPVYGPHHPLPH